MHCKVLKTKKLQNDLCTVQMSERDEANEKKNACTWCSQIKNKSEYMRKLCVFSILFVFFFVFVRFTEKLFWKIMDCYVCNFSSRLVLKWCRYGTRNCITCAINNGFLCAFSLFYVIVLIKTDHNYGQWTFTFIFA